MLALQRGDVEIYIAPNGNNNKELQGGAVFAVSVQASVKDYTDMKQQQRTTSYLVGECVFTGEWL